MDVGWPRGGRARAAELYSVWLRLMSERKRAKRGRLTSVCSTNANETKRRSFSTRLLPCSLARSLARCHATAGSRSRRRRRLSLTRGAGPSFLPPSFPGMLPLPMPPPSFALHSRMEPVSGPNEAVGGGRTWGGSSVHWSIQRQVGRQRRCERASERALGRKRAARRRQRRRRRRNFPLSLST